MTRKDYELLAQHLNDEFSQISNYESANRPFILSGFVLAISALCLALKEDNNRFNADRFMATCTRSQ